MVKNEKKYEKISDEARQELEEEIYLTIIQDFRKEMEEENFYKYEVVLHDIKFVTYMEDEELRLSVRLAIDLLEELKEINNNGMDRQVYEQLLTEAKTKENEVIQVLYIWSKIKTNNMSKLFAEIDRVRRVGGAWALLIANPGLIGAVCSVYERLVDQFEDQNLYALSGYFLLRAIMKMHSDEVE